eukprot:507071_1
MLRRIIYNKVIRNGKRLYGYRHCTNSVKTTASLKDQFQDQGYLNGIPLFNENEMSYYTNELNKLESRIEGQKFVGQELNPHLTFKFLWDLATHEKIVNILKQIYSDGLALLGTALFAKYPSENINDVNTKLNGKYVGFHQDVTYWGLSPSKAIAVWIAFDKTTEENGAMLYIPGTHKHGIYEHQIKDAENNTLIDGQQIPDELFNVNDGVLTLLNAGEIAIHSGTLIHGSSSNCSNEQRRCGFVLRYIDLETKVSEWNYKTQMKEWRTPRLICGTPKTDQYYYPIPMFVDNPPIPKPYSWKNRQWFSQE